MSPVAASTAPLRSALDAVLDEDRRAWLAAAEAKVAADPGALEVVFPGVGRRTARGPLHPADDPQDPHTWSVDDAARVVLVVAAAPSLDLTALYRQGDAAERRAVLRALAFLEDPSDGAALVDDAIRTNDPRLIAAALGSYAVDTLDDAAYEQAILKCVFVGIPLGGLTRLDERVTPELSRMLAAYAHERVAAGRSITPDVWPLIDRFPPEAELAAIAAERDHPDPNRRAAADAALADHHDAPE